MNRQHTPIVQTLDSAIHRINHYPADKRSGNPPYEHIVANTIFFQPKRKNLLITELFYYLGTSLMRPPRLYDKDFMAQRRSH